MPTADQILREFGITVPHMRGGNVKTKCPVCGPTRKNKHDHSLSVKIDRDGVMFFCHNCGNKGGKFYDQSSSHRVAGKPRNQPENRDSYGAMLRGYQRQWAGGRGSGR